MLFAALWLISDIAIEFISPKPLPNFLVIAGFVPALLVGVVLHWQRRHEQPAWPLHDEADGGSVGRDDQQAALVF